MCPRLSCTRLHFSIRITIVTVKHEVPRAQNALFWTYGWYKIHEGGVIDSNTPLELLYNYEVPNTYRAIEIIIPCNNVKCHECPSARAHIDDKKRRDSLLNDDQPCRINILMILYNPHHYLMAEKKVGVLYLWCYETTLLLRYGTAPREDR